VSNLGSKLLQQLKGLKLKILSAIVAITLATLSTSAAMAGDYDNTAMQLTAQSDAYSVSVKSPKTGATEFAVGSTVGPVDVTGTWLRNGAVDNYALKVGKEVAVAGLVYAGAEAEFTFGDSYTTDTRTLIATPYVGVAHTMGQLTPYAQVGYAFKSTSNDALNFARNDSYLEVGANYAVTPVMAVKLAIKETRDTNFKNAGDKNATVGVTVNF
tara:strand:+ start:392 stop:1030 length:639 start_codon:yes stop_codon:yes gene_type:complete